MCGRYVVKNPVTKTSKLVKSAIQVEDNENYNAHPYQKLPVIKKYINGNTLENLTWGIIPSWSKKKDFKALTNARLETIDEKISLEGRNVICVPVSFDFPISFNGFFASPLLNSTKYFFPSLLISKSNFSDRALTTETPTPCNPPETL